MTISSVTSKVIFVGTGSTAAAARVFAYPFRILRAADLTVSEYNNASSSATVKTLDTDYDVSGVGVDSGGNVTITGSYTNLPTGSQLVIQRVVDLTQETDYVENDAFPAQTHENALDKLTMGLQQLQEQVDRAILADISQTASNINVVSSVLAANSSAAVAVTQASAAAASAASVDFSDPTFTGTTNATTLACTLLTSSTSRVSGTSNTITLIATLLTASSVQTSGDIYSVAWTDYSATSTVVGWSNYVAKEIYYKKIGKTVFVSFGVLGTSNATTISFTLPYVNSAMRMDAALSAGQDNGTSVTHIQQIYLAASSSTVTVGGTVWTNSGTKSVYGQFFYESE